MYYVGEEGEDGGGDEESDGKSCLLCSVCNDAVELENVERDDYHGGRRDRGSESDINH